MSIENIINEAWENKDQVNPNSDKSLKDVINQIINDLDSGKVRVAEKISGEWITNQYIVPVIMWVFEGEYSEIIEIIMVVGFSAMWFLGQSSKNS